MDLKNNIQIKFQTFNMIMIKMEGD